MQCPASIMPSHGRLKNGAMSTFDPNGPVGSIHHHSSPKLLPPLRVMECRRCQLALGHGMDIGKGRPLKVFQDPYGGGWLGTGGTEGRKP